MTDDLRLRGLSTPDIPVWNRLLADVEREDRTGEHYNEDDLAEELVNPDIDPAKDIVGGFVGEELVAYFYVVPRSAAEGVHRVIVDGAVHPAHRGRGIGTRMVQAMYARSLEAHRERHPRLGLQVTLRGLSDNKAQESLVAGIGLLPDRWSFVMRADLSDVPAPPSVPGGLDLRTYDGSWSAAMHEAHNAAFVDHPHFTPWSDTMWKQWVTESRNFRPDMSLVMLDPAVEGKVVAYLQTNEYDAYEAMTGRREAFVAKVGTRREYRGRGLASCLLGHALARYRQDGYDEASLDVDSENPTGALGIYQRAGFTVESRWSDYVVTVDEGAACSTPGPDQPMLRGDAGASST